MTEVNEAIGSIEEIDGMILKVRLPDGSVVAAELDTDRLRKQHGPIYGLNLGDKVLLELDDPVLVSFLITYAATEQPEGS